MSLDVVVRDQQLILQDQVLCLNMNLHDGLLLLIALDQVIGTDEQHIRKTLEQFYRQLMQSLLLLPPRQLQDLLREASLETLACLMRLFKHQPLEKSIQHHLSNRRWEQIRDEPLYEGLDIPSIDQFKQALAPFFANVLNKARQGDLKLRDPEGVYF